MKSNLLKALALGFLVVSLAACGTQAPPQVIVNPPAAQPSLPSPSENNATAAGRWNGDLTEGAASIPVRATLVDNNGVLSGTMTVCVGVCLTSTSVSGTRAGTNVIITATFIGNQGQVLRANVQGTLSGDNISGTMTFNGLSGQITLDR